MYRIDLGLTYSTSAAATTVRTGLTALLATHPLVVATVGGTGTRVTLTGTAPTQEAGKAFLDAMTAVWLTGARTSPHVGLSKVA